MLRAANRFQSIVRALFLQDLLHVIVHRGAADVKLFGSQVDE